MSTSALEDIADKVAVDFRSHWLMASEFKYDNQTPVYLNVVFPPARSIAKSGPAAANQIAAVSTSASTNIVFSAAGSSVATAPQEKIEHAENSPKSSSSSLSSSASTQ